MTFPSATLFAAAGGVRRTHSAPRRDRGFSSVQDEPMPLHDYYDLVGFEAQKENEARLAAAASALVEGRTL